MAANVPMLTQPLFLAGDEGGSELLVHQSIGVKCQASIQGKQLWQTWLQVLEVTEVRGSRVRQRRTLGKFRFPHRLPCCPEGMGQNKWHS